MKGPGIFIIPIVDTVPYWIDVRVIHQFIQSRKDFTKEALIYQPLQPGS